MDEDLVVIASHGFEIMDVHNDSLDPPKSLVTTW